MEMYRHTSNIRRNLIDSKFVDHSDVGAAPTSYIFIPDLTPGFKGLGKDNC